MALIDNGGGKSLYVRPHNKVMFPTFTALNVDSQIQQDTTMQEVPPAGTMRPAWLRTYEETHVSNGAPVVVCSGGIRLMGGHTDPDSGAYDQFGGHYIGILTKDSAPGDRASFATRGRFRFEADAGDAAKGRHKISERLEGKRAFYLVDEGYVTDIQPGGGERYLEVGTFASDLEHRPMGVTWGTLFAQVDLRPISQNSMAAPVELMNVANTTAEDVHLQAFPEIRGQEDLVVDFYAGAVAGHPYFKVETVEWNFTGSTGAGGGLAVEGQGEMVSYAFDTAGTYQIAMKVKASDKYGRAGLRSERDFLFNVVVSANGETTISPALDGLANAVILSMPRPRILGYRMGTDGNIRVDLDHFSIVGQSGGPELERDPSDAYSRDQFTGLVDSVGWEIPAQANGETFEGGGTTSSADAVTVVIDPSSDAEYLVDFTLDTTALNGIGAMSANLAIVVSGGQITAQFVPSDSVEDGATATDFDHRSNTIAVGAATPDTVARTFDTTGAAATSAAAEANYDYSSAGAYTNELAIDFTESGQVSGTHRVQYTLEVQ